MAFLYTCPVCIDELIAPVTMPCGHTVCYSCTSQLIKRICPVCRSDIPKKCSISLLLDSILLNLIPEYTIKKTAMLAATQVVSIIKSYGKSTRYFHLLTCIDTYLEVEGHATLDTLLMVCESDKTVLSVDPIADEVLFILNTICTLETHTTSITASIIPITIHNETYYVDYENKGNLHRFALLYKDDLTPNDIYKIISVCNYDDTSELFSIININTTLDIKYDLKVLSSHLEKLSLVASVEYESQSESESDEDI